MAKIMIVDDAAFMRMKLQNILEKANHKIVAEAENGQIAIKTYSEINPDLVIMDITMPEMNGIEATKKIMEINDRARIIMCSAMGQQKMVVKSIEAGASDFIVKPFKEERIIKAVSRVLQ